MSGPRVLLTGANGFIGSHILNQLLEKSVFVQAVVRSKEKASKIAKDFPHAGKSKLGFSIVPDITAPKAFENCIKESLPLSAIIHTASPVSSATIPSEYIEPAIQGTLQILEAAHNYAPSLKRFVYTSSIQSVVNPLDLNGIGTHYSSNSWNPVTMDQAMSGPLALTYSASKTFAEKAAWEFMKIRKPQFELVVLNPPGVFGPHRNHIESTASLNASNKWLYRNLMLSERSTAVPPDTVPLTVDVRDLALAHYQAAFAPGVGNRRYLVAEGSHLNQEICDYLRTVLGSEWEGRIPLGSPGNYTPAPDAFKTDLSDAQEILGRAYRSFEETFTDTGRYIADLHQKSPPLSDVGNETAW
ncbi:Glycine-rich RNA-binding protein 2, mitochondrial [Knufia peltigerae]|uniref:Glycine-rich RNA-binding protein 2, mitochondrial n=1 Tax=Knufia peltigerae TaxID=1002370 RepID=A0AA38YEU1_9EURO|nr:Glycine-rich RNA-binding protein 2, mitochondrial [Knufia peltigerae]